MSESPEQEFSRDAERLTDFLRDRDAECPQCGYNLRNLTSPRCPECGQALQLSVTLVEPYLRAWITLLVAMCAGTGLGVLWIILLPQHGRPPDVPFVGMLMHLTSIPLVPVLVVKRRWFLRMQRPSQWRWAVVGIVWFAVSIVFIAGLR
jgi:hypothetical protein